MEHAQDRGWPPGGGSEWFGADDRGVEASQFGPDD
jgi:hypothetical protein